MERSDEAERFIYYGIMTGISFLAQEMRESSMDPSLIEEMVEKSLEEISANEDLPWDKQKLAEFINEMEVNFKIMDVFADLDIEDEL